MTSGPPTIQPPSRRVGRGCAWLSALGGLGVVVGVPLAYAATDIIGHAWRVCGDLEPPYAFALLVGQFPLTAVAIVVTWVAAIILTRRRSVPTSIIVSTGAAVLIAWGSIAISVPMNEAPFYMGPELPISSECGRGGVPTWWPRWVPV